MITREEYGWLNIYRSEGFRWIIRDKNKGLYVYTTEPEKRECEWRATKPNSNADYIKEGYRLFPCVTWEDEEPTKIDDLIRDYESHQVIVGEKVKVTIPQYVAEWIEHVKDMERPIKLELLFYTLSMPIEVREWLVKDDRRTDILARAWLDGFVVEKEKLYTVQLKNGYHLCKYEGTGVRWLNMTEFNTADCYKLTKAEIESVDPRLMQFAVEVE